ncbi:MAG: AAA family ATPase [Proteobacteria bacterium]|nr:AAA family ATPase [Pseudomonadota bacterium]HQR04196.1 AAA family ATPase [Rhodocyclaceae bacterium]
MYLAHFGLLEYPFGLTPDTSYIYSASGHQEALNTLLIALKSGEGFIKITGEVGMGKTLLCRRFMASLDEHHQIAYIPNPQLDPRALLHALAEELGVQDGPGEIYHIIRRINRRLAERVAEDRSVVLCIDEAQSMPPLTLESLRLLSNLETEKRKLLHIVLFGQPELDALLARPSARQLRQRIAFHCKMPGLKRDEMDHYLEHRLRAAGHHDASLFTPMARRMMYLCSRGTPRLVNILANKSLMAAYGEGKPTVSARHVLRAAKDTPDVGRLTSWLPGV